MNRRDFLLGGLVAAGAVAAGGYGFTQGAQFGRLPSGERLARCAASPHYKNGHFQNLVPVPVMSETEGERENRFVATAKFIFGDKTGLKPEEPMLATKTDLHALPRERDAVVWMGHSTFYIQVGGYRAIVDPVLSDYASPLFFINKAFAGSNVYTAEDIPELDALLITHDHWDHLDYPTVMALKDKVKAVVCPLGVGEHFERWEWDMTRVHEEDWGAAVRLAEGLSSHVLPSQHFSGRFLTQNPTLWGGFALVTPGRKVYISGDGGYGKHFKAIGEKFGGFDVAIMENGQYNLAWHAIHMLPEETAQAAADVGARMVIPGHNGKFALARHVWQAPLRDLKAASAEYDYTLLTPKIGECVPLATARAEDYGDWWEEMR